RPASAADHRRWPRSLRVRPRSGSCSRAGQALLACLRDVHYLALVVLASERPAFLEPAACKRRPVGNPHVRRSRALLRRKAVSYHDPSLAEVSSPVKVGGNLTT